MAKVKERRTAWLETIRNFFISDEEIENEDNNDKGYQEWKKANADIIDEKSIDKLEKMLEHRDKRRKNSSKNSMIEKVEAEIPIDKEGNKDEEHETDRPTIYEQEK